MQCVLVCVCVFFHEEQGGCGGGAAGDVVEVCLAVSSSLADFSLKSYIYACVPVCMCVRIMYE
jgi:hypothetical protein